MRRLPLWERTPLAGVFRLDRRYGMLQPGKALYDDGAVPSTLPAENTLFVTLPSGRSASLHDLPYDPIVMVYVHATPEGRLAHERRIEAGDLLLFRQAGLHGEGPIHEIWQRSPEDLIALAKVMVADESGFRRCIYVDMMAVREVWRRNGLNLALMRTLLQRWPKRELCFSSLTKDGKAFVAAARKAGLPVARL